MAGLGIAGLPEWALPVLAQGDSVVQFTDMPENSVAVIDLPPPPPTSRSIDPRYLVAITLVIGGSMVLALAQALRRR